MEKRYQRERNRTRMNKNINQFNIASSSKTRSWILFIRSCAAMGPGHDCMNGYSIVGAALIQDEHGSE